MVYQYMKTMSGTIVFDDTVSSTVRPLLGPPLGWVVITVLMYMWVGCTVHVSFTGWALPTQYLSLSVHVLVLGW